MEETGRKKLVINCNDCFALYNFRLDLLKELRKHYRLYIIAKKDEYYELLQNEGFVIIDSLVIGNKNNPIKDISLIIFLRKLFKKIKPDIIINYTIKPHIYGTLVSKNAKVINFVSGVGSVFLKENLLFKICKCLYKYIAKKVDLYIFLNKDDQELFRKHKLIKNSYTIIQGEGVNLEKFEKEVNFNLPITFIFVGRLIKEKGIKEYLEAARIVKEKYPKIRFLIVGNFYNKNSVIQKNEIIAYHKQKIIEYLGYTYKINEVLKEVHVVVLPSYREGFPISLIEGLASKKFLIATNVAGCREVCIDGYNGFIVEAKNVNSLVQGIIKYINFEDKELLHENALNSSYQYAKEFYVERMVDLIGKI